MEIKSIDADAGEDEIREAIAHVLHDLGRMTVSDERYAARHEFLDALCLMLPASQPTTQVT